MLRMNFLFQSPFLVYNSFPVRRDAGAVERGGLENRYRSRIYRGFESHSLRSFFIKKTENPPSKIG